MGFPFCCGPSPEEKAEREQQATVDRDLQRQKSLAAAESRADASASRGMKAGNKMPTSSPTKPAASDEPNAFASASAYN